MAYKISVKPIFNRSDPSTKSFWILIQSSRKYANQVKRVTINQENNFSSSHDYQFMQRSKLPTFYFQRSLPRLPIPLVEKSCERFLAATKPILSTDEYKRTEEVVTNFRNNEAMQLNALLKQKDMANKHTSYISEPWFHMYLSDRSPLPLNYNPVLVMKNDTRSEYQSQLVRATNLIISSLRFWRSLQEDLLKPEIFHLNSEKTDTERFSQIMRIVPKSIATYAAYAFKAFPLDMSQYKSLFGVSRVPELQKDRLVQNSNSRHILVMRRGNMYAVDVLDSNGLIENPKVILSRLRAVIRKDTEQSAAETPIGILTSGNRDDWAHTRNYLIKQGSPVNKELLENEVDGALFCLCLDNVDDPIFNEQNSTPLFKHLLAGVGTNRWFDKSVSLLVSADGTAAVNFEHSWGDGVAVLRYFNEIYNETLNQPFVSENDSKHVYFDTNDCSVRSIHFHIDNKVRIDVQSATDKHQKIVDSLNMELVRYPYLNKDICKKNKISADCIMQLSFQLAYRQAFNAYVGTYESCSTAAFRHGRTETMRPCNVFTKQFCETLLQSNKTQSNSEQLRAIINQCSILHGQLTKDAAMGQGFDRHLFALKNIAITNNLPIPEIYNTEAYNRLNYNIISTSTLSSNALLAGSFGPVVSDGLGIGYSIQNDECGAIITSYGSQGKGKHFAESLAEAFETIYEILSTNRK